MKSKFIMKDAHGTLIPDKDRYIRKVTYIGFGVNLLLTALKFGAGIWGHSQALVADAIHSLSDGVTDMVVIVGSYFWSKPPDLSHPYGHRRLETLVTLFIGIVLLAVGAGICYEALSSLRHENQQPPEKAVLVVAGVTMLAKEILYRWTRRAGMGVRSPALLANAWHHRSDAISTIPALLAVAGAVYLPQWAFLDHVGAAAVSVLIAQAALKIMVPALREIVETGASTETCEKIRKTALSHPSVLQVHAIRTRYVGASILADLHIIVDGDMSVRQGHEVAETVKERILQTAPDVVDAVIHVEPPESGISKTTC